jgi:hypothetical protein
MKDGRIDELIAFSHDHTRGTLGITDWLRNLHEAAGRLRDQTVDLAKTTIDRLNDARKAAHRQTVRSVLLPLVADELDLPTELSDEDKAIESTIGGQYDVLFVGHTHHRRLAPRTTGHGFHVNTGTWADRMTLLRRDVGDSTRFAQVYEALISPDRSVITDPQLGLVRRECTVAALQSLAGKNQTQVLLGKVPDGSDQFEAELSEAIEH